MSNAIRVEGGKGIKLRAVDAQSDGGLVREKGEKRFAALAVELGELQELLYAAQTMSLLVVLQGLDTSGKDGTIRNVFRDVNPQGCQVVPFKVPTEHELAHDFLWRVHRETPEKGMITVFNRSHYEDVVVVRVKELVLEKVWRARYDQINAFEQLLTKNGTTVVKFYLHISKEEQEERLLAREQDVAKAWKLSSGDWIERRSWEAYIDAYDDALSRCSTSDAPWYVIPANRKWFRNLAIAETLVDVLRPYRDDWLKALEQRGKQELEAIHAARAAAGKQPADSQPVDRPQRTTTNR